MGVGRKGIEAEQFARQQDIEDMFSAFRIGGDDFGCSRFDSEKSAKSVAFPIKEVAFFKCAPAPDGLRQLADFSTIQATRQAERLQTAIAAVDLNSLNACLSALNLPAQLSIFAVAGF